MLLASKVGVPPPCCWFQTYLDVVQVNCGRNPCASVIVERQAKIHAHLRTVVPACAHVRPSRTFGANSPVASLVVDLVEALDPVKDRSLGEPPGPEVRNKEAVIPWYLELSQHSNPEETISYICQNAEYFSA